MIQLQQLSVRAGPFVLKDINLAIPTGAYGVLMGRTGTGKTTILEAICGLRHTIAGQIILMDCNVTASRVSERGVGYVPQDRALFQTMSVREHLAFALVIRKWRQLEIDQRVLELSDLLGIDHLLNRRPQNLSGGEAQRVALGRALSSRPGILLLDEPLSALDDQTREEMYTLLKSVKERTGVTTLHITHNANEARRLADCVFVMTSEGGCVQPVPLNQLPGEKS